LNNIKLKKTFPLELGGAIDDVNICYHTYGKLNAAKDNVIMVIHALTANSEVADWWNGLFGIGNFFDPEKYFIICANNLGSPYGTTSAKTINPKTGKRYGLKFPTITIKDTARLQLLLLEELNITNVKFLMGGSCGGNIAQEMTIISPDTFENMILLCCSAQETPWVIGIHESQRIALRADPSLQVNSAKAGQDGLRAARAMALPFYRSHISFKVRQSEDLIGKTNDFKASSYIKYQGQKFIQRFDAHCYYKLLSVLDTHNVGRQRGGIQSALSLIQTNTLILGFDSDILIPVDEQKILREYIPFSKLEVIKSLFGHDAFLIESDKIREVIKGHFGIN